MRVQHQEEHSYTCSLCGCPVWNTYSYCDKSKNGHVRESIGQFTFDHSDKGEYIANKDNVSTFRNDLLQLVHSNPYKWVMVLPEDHETITRLKIKIQSCDLDNHYSVKVHKHYIGVRYNG